MSTATIVNNSFIADLKARPVNHAAAATFVGTSVYVGHEGLMAALPATLGWALTGLFTATAVLQWTAHGRKAECEDARDEDRAQSVTSQVWRFGAIEAALFAMGVLAIAAKEGVAAYSLAGWAGAIAGGVLFAWSSYKVKWTSCDAITDRRRKPTPQTPASAPVRQPAPQPAADNVVSFDVEAAERRRQANESRILAAVAEAVTARDQVLQRRQKDAARKRAARALVREVRVAAG